MTRYRVEFDGMIRDEQGTPVTNRSEVQEIADRILLELTKLASLDPTVIAQPPTGGLRVSVKVEESEVFMASMAGFTQIRTAVHAAGIGTPGWKVEWFRTSTDTSTEAGQSDDNALMGMPTG